MPQFAQQWLTSGRRSERLLAILALGHLRDKSAWDALFAQAVSDDSLVSLQAARALLQIDPVRGVQHLMPLLIKRHDWDINRLAVMLAASRSELEGLLSRKITRVDPANMGRLMRLAEALKLNLPAEVLAYLVDAARPVDILVAGLRLVNNAELLPQVRGFAGHTHWTIPRAGREMPGPHRRTHRRALAGRGAAGPRMVGALPRRAGTGRPALCHR